MCCAVRSEFKAARPPLLDCGPAQVLQAIPGVSDVPGIRFPDVVRNKEGGGGEAEVGQHRIGMLGEGCVAIIERQQERARCAVRRAPYAKFG